MLPNQALHSDRGRIRFSRDTTPLWRPRRVNCCVRPPEGAVRGRLMTRPLDPERDWMFFRPPSRSAAQVRGQIRPLDEASSRLVWDGLIRCDQYPHPMQLPPTHWSHNRRAVGPDWIAAWNRWLAGAAPDPDPVAAFLRSAVPWPEEAPVLFVEHRDHATLATWGAFVAAWPHFLYSDEGPLLVSWERPEFLGFGPTGMISVGMRGPAEQAAAADRPRD